MGKKHKEDYRSLKERLRKLEKRFSKGSRHDHADDYYARRKDRDRSRTRSRSPHRRRYRAATPSQSRTPRSSHSSTRWSSRSPKLQSVHSPTSQRSRSPTPRPSHSLTPQLEDVPLTQPLPQPSPPIQEKLGGQNTDEQTPKTPIVEIPADIEKLLGQEGTPGVSNAVDLHDSLAKRWLAILQNGLNNETKMDIIKKHDPPKNCGLLVPPILNVEVVAALNESSIKRDKRILEQQKTLAAGISAAGKVLNEVISEKSKVQLIEDLSDAARLLCALYHELTSTRRNLILPGLNKEVKEMLEKTPISEHLFGDKLQEQVSACKAVKKKSAQEMKNTQAKLPTKPANNLNFRGPPRMQVPRRGGPAPKQRQHNSTQKTSTASRSRRSPPKAQPPRRQNHRRR